MNLNQNLTTEIVKKIMFNFGILTSQIGHYSLSDSKIKLPITFDEEIDGKVINYDIYCGQITADNTVITAMFADFSNIEDKLTEYYLLISSSQSQIYGLSLSGQNDEDRSVFKIFENKIWYDAPVIKQAKALIGSELIMSYGLTWQNVADHTTLYGVMHNFIEGA